MHVYPMRWGGFSSHGRHFRDSSERRGTIGACRYLEVLEGDFFHDLKEAIFRFYESEIRFRASLALDKPADIPRIDGA